MKLIWKGLLISVLFVLLSVSVRADLDPVFYFDNDMFNNYPYGDNSYFYQCSHGQPSSQYPWTSHGCDANYPVGSSLRENNNDRYFNLNKILGFCVLGDDDHGNDCETGENNDYWASGEFYFFNPEARTMHLQYRVDDEIFLIMNDETQTFYNIHRGNSNGWQGLSIDIPAGWINWHVMFKEWESGDHDHLQIFPLDASFYETHNSVPYYYKMTAVSSPTNINLVKQRIHLNEGSVANDCKDFTDNDGDWNLDGEMSNDGAAAFDFNEAIYGIDPPQGRGYKILNDDYPQFGELNVDCFDQGCEGQDGPYDYNGSQGKCNYATEKLMYCDDGYDNDFDGLKDLNDPDCTSFCQGGNLSLSVLSLLGTQYDPEATDGRDACCGDDGFAMCIPGTALIYPPPCNYVTQTTCEANLWCKWNPSNFCELKTRPEYCAQFSQSDCPSGACQFKEGDYGYVTPSNDYLCYNNNSNFRAGTEDKWMWIFAPEKPFLITPLNFSGKTVDYVSNYEKWYYCNADVTTGLKGLPVQEYMSFPGPTTGGLTMTCSMAASNLLYTQYNDCVSNPTVPCCFDTEGSFNLITNPEKLLDCKCNVGTGGTQNFCDIPEHQYLDICKDLGFTTDKILTEYCAQNPRNCVTMSYYNPLMPCNLQPFGAGHTCTDEQVCSNGLMLEVLNGEMCCIGVSTETECIDKTSVTDQTICENAGGQYYEKSNTTFCFPSEQQVNISQTEGCCFGAIFYTNTFPWSGFEDQNNNTFSCYAYQGNNLFGQCCYGLCNNMEMFTGTFVDATRNRAFSIKLPYGIQNSYDEYTLSVGVLEDYSRDTNTVNHSLEGIASFKTGVKMEYFDNLEFDIIYNKISNVKNIYINDVPYGSLTQYVNNGDRGLVAHHVIIPLLPASKMQTLTSIKIITDPTDVDLTYDNIYLSVNTDTPESSLDRYCTGGFGAWIGDMDSLVTDFNSDFYIGENAWMSGYGRYAEVCGRYLPFGWTGHYCCGDDTTANNYGEFYEDSALPTWPSTGGCFDGSKVSKEDTVWRVKGYYDDKMLFFSGADELKSYAYSDLIYNDDSFIGCQVPQGKYSNLRVSTTGLTPPTSNPLLINNMVDDQCSVIGQFYCFNGVWRQYVPGLEQTYVGENNMYFPTIPPELHLKSIPPATELLKNGKFGGDCPPTVCAQQGNNTGT